VRRAIDRIEHVYIHLHYPRMRMLPDEALTSKKRDSSGEECVAIRDSSYKTAENTHKTKMGNRETPYETMRIRRMIWVRTVLRRDEYDAKRERHHEKERVGRYNNTLSRYSEQGRWKQSETRWTCVLKSDFCWLNTTRSVGTSRWIELRSIQLSK